MNTDASQRFPASQEQFEQVILVVDDTPENLVAMDAILGDLNVQLLMVGSAKPLALSRPKPAVATAVGTISSTAPGISAAGPADAPAARK